MFWSRNELTKGPKLQILFFSETKLMITHLKSGRAGAELSANQIKSRIATSAFQSSKRKFSEYWRSFDKDVIESCQSCILQGVRLDSVLLPI